MGFKVLREVQSIEMIRKKRFVGFQKQPLDTIPFLPLRYALETRATQGPNVGSESLGDRSVLKQSPCNLPLTKI